MCARAAREKMCFFKVRDAVSKEKMTSVIALWQRSKGSSRGKRKIKVVSRLGAGAPVLVPRCWCPVAGAPVLWCPGAGTPRRCWCAGTVVFFKVRDAVSKEKCHKSLPFGNAQKGSSQGK